MAGVGVGISDDLISLEIGSPDVPDLTLIDLPGIARVAVKGQPENIGEQVHPSTPHTMFVGIHCIFNPETKSPHDMLCIIYMTFSD